MNKIVEKILEEQYIQAEKIEEIKKKRDKEFINFMGKRFEEDLKRYEKIIENENYR